jgi:hypothetical protein
MLTSYALDHALRVDTVEKAEAVFNHAAQMAAITPYQKKQAGLAIETVLTALLWQRANGKFPDRLEELTESGCLAAIPADPYSNTTLVYRRTDNGFILYSVGPNFTDDSGQIVPDETKGFKMWNEKGNEVFWPVEVN